jgi:hypothetical protein
MAMSLHPPIAASRARLALGQIIRGSYGNVFARPGVFLARLAPWYSVIVAITVARLLQGTLNGFDTGYMMWLGRIATGAEFVGALFFAVHWNRVTLLREGVAQAPLFSLRALRFLAMLAVTAVLVALFATGAVGLIAVFGNLRAMYHVHLGLVLLILLVFGAARLLPTLALASVDYRGSELVAALRLTRGYGLALFQGIFAVAIPALVGRSAMLLLARLIDGPATLIVFQMLAAAFTFLAVALGIGFAAHAYIALSRLDGAGSADHRA